MQKRSGNFFLRADWVIKNVKEGLGRSIWVYICKLIGMISFYKFGEKEKRF